MTTTADIDKEINAIQGINASIKNDIDGLLDAINRLQKLQDSHKDMPEDLKKNLEKSMSNFKALFMKYSSLLNVNEESLKKAGELRVQIGRMEDQ